tara:strand:- start:52 stop:381 length:330 start_codon:yes stop_codon:yes gene_type:complete
MNLDKTLKKLMTEKKELTNSLELCCESIGFWEERAEEIFKKMDEFEEEALFSSGESHDKKFKTLQRESGKIMKRVDFENNQLDLLEAQILDLEEKIIITLARYAKKQKK